MDELQHTANGHCAQLTFMSHSVMMMSFTCSCRDQNELESHLLETLRCGRAPDTPAERVSEHPARNGAGRHCEPAHGANMHVAQQVADVHARIAPAVGAVSGVVVEAIREARAVKQRPLVEALDPRARLQHAQLVAAEQSAPVPRAPPRGRSAARSRRPAAARPPAAARGTRAR